MESIMKILRRTLLAGAALCLLMPARLSFAAEAVTLRVSLTPSIFNAMFDRMIKEFEAANPDIKIKIAGSHRDQGDQFQATLRESLVNDLPEISFQGFAYIPELKERRITVRLDDRIAGDPKLKDQGIAGPVLDSGKVGNEVHALGVGMSYPIIYVNANLVRKAGADPENLPRDWDGILALAKRINALGNGVQGGFFQVASGGNWTWIALVESLGSKMMASDGKLLFTGAEGMRSLEVIRAFGEAGQAKNDVSQDQARTVFKSGVIGIMFDSGSSLANFETVSKDILDVRTLPLPLAEQGHIPPAGIAVLLHARDARLQDAAWRFMTFAAGAKGQVLVGTGTGYVPANLMTIKTPELLGNYYKERKTSAAALASAEHATTWFAFPGDNSIKVSYEIRDHLRELVTLKKTPHETMAAIEKSVRALVPTAK
jgi:multiple sugar transport system substrate-binding protein